MPTFKNLKSMESKKMSDVQICIYRISLCDIALFICNRTSDTHDLPLESLKYNTVYC